MRRAFAFTVAFSLVALAACGGGSSDSTSKGSKTGSDTTEPTGISASDPGCRYIVAGAASRETNPGTTLEYLNTAIVEPFACYDKVTFTFTVDAEAPVTTTTGDGVDASTCSPSYIVEYRKEAPFGLVKPDGKNVATTTGGFDDAKAVLYVEMKPAIAISEYPSRPELAYPGNITLSFPASDMHHVVIVEWVKKLPEGESTSTPTTTPPGVIPFPQRVVWLIGLDQKRPFTVDCANAPPSDDGIVRREINILIMK